MRSTGLIRFEIAGDTEARLARLLKSHPELSRLLGGGDAAPVDAVLEYIFAVGIAQLERCARCDRSSAIEPGSCRYACEHPVGILELRR